MKVRNFVIAGVTTGIAVTPYCAHHFRPNRFPFDISLEQWFISGMKGEDARPVFLLVTALCALGGSLLGLFLAKVIRPSEPEDKGRLSLLRTPLAAAILVPIGIGTIVFLVYNHTSAVLDNIVWPEFDMKSMVIYAIVAAVAGANLAGFLNVCEQAFERSNMLVKLGITCCLPLALVVGIASVLGLIGGAILSGVLIGRTYDCPFTGAWTGFCLAITFLAIRGGIFWPAYFPFSAHGGK
jgi:hypothetical protein